MDKNARILFKEIENVFVEISKWSKLNRLAGFPSDLYDKMMELINEIKNLENKND